MKALVAIVLLFTSGTVAAAKPTPLEERNIPLANANIEAVTGTMRERQYFQVSQQPPNSGYLYCRWRPILFDKTPLKLSCR
jgi:hypothetical protein